MQKVKKQINCSGLHILISSFIFYCSDSTIFLVSKFEISYLLQVPYNIPVCNYISNLWMDSSLSVLEHPLLSPSAVFNLSCCSCSQLLVYHLKIEHNVNIQVYNVLGQGQTTPWGKKFCIRYKIFVQMNTRCKLFI